MKIRELSKIIDVRCEDIMTYLRYYGYSFPLLENEEVCLGHIECLKSYFCGQKYSESYDFVHIANILEHLDLSQILSGTYNHANIFRLLYIRMIVDSIKKVEIDLTSSFAESKDASRNQFSLLIGVNGVGKSAILREIVDFFIDFQTYLQMHQFRSLSKRYVQITGVSYIANGEIYHIDKNIEQKQYEVNGVFINEPNIPIPNIVASCFGITDKFPVKRSFSSSLRNSRYNTTMYSYVGAKAANNMFSPSTTLFQMMENILHLEKTSTILKVGEILNFIGYARKFTFACNVNKSIKTLGSFLDFEEFLHRELDKKHLISLQSHYNVLSKQQQQSLYKTYTKLLRNVEKDIYFFSIPFDKSGILKNRDEARNLYFLRQIGAIKSVECFLYNNHGRIRSGEISSGELNLFCTIVAALSASESGNVLVLLDEPEISQHPNWQMQMIDLLNDSMKDNTCHFIIASHSHFLVSDLPLHKSSVSYLYKDSDTTYAKRIEEETYGWSAEEVLLKVFKVPTIRNIYLANIVGKFLDNIANNNIDKKEAAQKVSFLREVVANMNQVDPMKKIVLTIIETFDND